MLTVQATRGRDCDGLFRSVPLSHSPSPELAGSAGSHGSCFAVVQRPMPENSLALATADELCLGSCEGDERGVKMTRSSRARRGSLSTRHLDYVSIARWMRQGRSGGVASMDSELLRIYSLNLKEPSVIGYLLRTSRLGPAQLRCGCVRRSSLPLLLVRPGRLSTCFAGVDPGIHRTSSSASRRERTRLSLPAPRHLFATPRRFLLPAHFPLSTCAAVYVRSRSRPLRSGSAPHLFECAVRVTLIECAVRSRLHQ